MVDFYNSGFPKYDGIEFNNEIALLGIIKQSLEASLWVTIADNIATTQDLLMRGTTSNDHLCDIEFWVDSNDPNNLVVRGLIEGIYTPTLKLEFTPGELNKIWLTCDRDSGVICIKNRYLYSGAINFGFLERWDDTDNYAWMVAKANNRLNDAYVAKSKHDDTIARQIGADFANADDFSSDILNGAYQGILDMMTIAHPYLSFTNTNLLNAGYSAHLGQVDSITNRPILTRRYYLEGRSRINNYPGLLYNRGFVKHLINGFGKVTQGKIEQDTEGNVYLVTGSDGWQGMILSSE